MSTATLMPYRPRWAHRAFARAVGYFWLPCPTCGNGFAGHERGSSMPDPERGPGAGRVICPLCTDAKRAEVSAPGGWTLLGDYIDEEYR